MWDDLLSREIASSNAIDRYRRLSTLNRDRRKEKERKVRRNELSSVDFMPRLYAIVSRWLWENDPGAKEARRAVIKSVKLVIRRGFAHALACAGSTFVSRSHLVHTAVIAISRCKARPPRSTCRDEPSPIFWKSRNVRDFSRFHGTSSISVTVGQRLAIFEIRCTDQWT